MGQAKELFKHHEEEKLLSKTPLILMTGFSDLTREKAIESGALELFYKPVRWSEVIDFIGKNKIKRQLRLPFLFFSA